MDPLFGIGSSLPAARARALADDDPLSPPFAPSLADETPVGSLDQLNRTDPEKAKEVMDHFVSHVSAECFISLLQIQDPMPFDHQKRAEWRRFYQQLHQALETPLPPDVVPPGVAPAAAEGDLPAA